MQEEGETADGLIGGVPTFRPRDERRLERAAARYRDRCGPTTTPTAADLAQLLGSGAPDGPPHLAPAPPPPAPPPGPTWRADLDAVRVDMTDDAASVRATAAAYGVTGLPTWLVLAPTGEELASSVGFVEAEGTLDKLRAACPGRHEE